MQQESLHPSELRTGISLAAVYVCRMLGLFMVIPVIAVAAKDYPDYSPLLIGIAIGGYGLTQAILQIPFGILSDKWGRKPVIYTGLGLFALGSLIAGLADSLAMMTAGRLLQGAGAIAGAVMALAADATRESQRAKVMAIIGVSIGFSFYLALLLGPILVGAIGLQGIFLFTAGLALLCFPLVRFGVSTPSSDNALALSNLPKAVQLPALIKNPFLLRLNVMVLSIHLLITLFFIFIPVLLIDLGVSLDKHYEVYLMVLLSSIVGLVILLRLSNKMTISNQFNIAVLLMAMAFVILTQSPDYLYIVICGILFFSGFNYLEAKMPAMVSTIAPPEQKGSAMGIYASFQFFGAFLGGTLGGIFASNASSNLAFYFSLVLIFAISLLARGLAKLENVKLLSMDLQAHLFEMPALDELIDKMSDVSGVKEVTADEQQKLLYIKADVNQFDLKQAQGYVEQFNALDKPDS